MVRLVPRIATFVVLVLFLASGACYLYQQIDFNFDNRDRLVKGVQRADKVVLYEGLPHQSYETNLLERELKSKKTIKLHEYPFYDEPLQLSEGDGKRLTDVYCAQSSLRPLFGQTYFGDSDKKCGGYHPDFCIQWSSGQDVYQILLCFGCSEVKSFGPKVRLYCDMTDEAAQQFKAILKAYRKNRPKYGPELPEGARLDD
jgi:hypothetical protein